MELGSEFNLDLQNLSIKENNIFKYLSDFRNVEYFDSGRSALKHFSSFLTPDYEILLPEFICESVINPFKDKRIIFYKLNNDFTIDVDDLFRKVHQKKQIIFLMHYFGAIQPYEILQQIKEIHDSTILEDTTHSIFSSKRTIGDYQICSIRKWLPIPQGGVLYSSEDKLKIFTNTAIYERSTDNVRAYGMILKELFLCDILDCNTTYRKLFSECESKLDKQEDIQKLSCFAKFIASCVDINTIIAIRKRNYQQLKISLSPPLDFQDTACPLAFPIRVKERDRLRTYLIEHKIYCAVHWPFDGFQANDRHFAQVCADELISLPIDQRYSNEHMEYLLYVLSKYRGDLQL